MYYDQKIIDGILMYRTTPDEEWRICSTETMGQAIMELQEKISRLEEIITDHESRIRADYPNH